MEWIVIPEEDYAHNGAYVVHEYDKYDDRKDCFEACISENWDGGVVG